MRKTLRSLIYNWYGIPSKISKFEEADQSFGAKAPWNTEPLEDKKYYSNIEDIMPEKLSKQLYVCHVKNKSATFAL